MVCCGHSVHCCPVLESSRPVTAARPLVHCSHTSRFMKGQVDTGCSSALRRKITTIVFPGENSSLIHQYLLPFILIHVDTCNLFDDGYKEDTSMTSEKALIKSYKFKLVCSGDIQYIRACSLVGELWNPLNMDIMVTKHSMDSHERQSESWEKLNNQGSPLIWKITRKRRNAWSLLCPFWRSAKLCEMLM